MKNLVVTVFSFSLFLISVGALGQNSTRNLNLADQLFYEYDFERAIKKYKKVLEYNSSPHVLRNLATSYAYLKDAKNACFYFEKLVHQPNPLPLDLLEYAQNLKCAGDYDEALVWFEKYREIYPLDLRARNHSVNTYHYKKLARNEKNPLFYPLDINDEGSIMGFTKVEDKLIFSKSQNSGSFDFMDTPEIFLDMMSGTLNEKMEFDKIRYMPFHINSDMHDGPSSYNEFNKTLAYNRNAEFIKSTSEDGGQQEILFSNYLGDEKWSEPVPFEFNSPNHSVGHPAFSPDGKKIYFISNQLGGFGGTDIYVSTRRGKEWTKPENLGPEVNTEADEMFPFVTDGDVLYFATSGHAGLGGLDIFKTYPFEEYWAKPENLGAPVNSRGDDFGIMFLNKGEALVISDRVGGAGSDDVYYVNIEETKNFFAIPTTLIDSKNISQITLLNTSTGKEKYLSLEQASHLELDLRGGDYIISWMHMGNPKEINIASDEDGELILELKGLDGLKSSDFLSQIEVLGSKKAKSKVKIDQKVWSYQTKESQISRAESSVIIPNYVGGKSNVIQLADGVEINNRDYPLPANRRNSELLFLNKSASESFLKARPTLEKLAISREHNDSSAVSIRLLNVHEGNQKQMDELVHQISEFLIERGVAEQLIDVSSVNPLELGLFDDNRKEKVRIYISANPNLTLTD